MSLLHIAGGATEDKLDSSDVFSTYLYTGNGSTQNIVNGIDLAGKGGMVWVKGRSAAGANMIFDTTRGVTKYIIANETGAEATSAVGDRLTSFNTNGFSIGLDPGSSVNFNGNTYASWTFRKAPKFFDVVTYTGNGVAGRQIPHNLGCEVGMCIIKSTNNNWGWYTYHRGSSVTPRNNYMYLNTTGSAFTDSGAWGGINFSDTHFPLPSYEAANSLGTQYVAYLFAHDPSADGIIQCGSYVANGGTKQKINIGWEPQYLLVKSVTSIAGWYIVDNMRGANVSSDGSGICTPLQANSSDAETAFINSYLFGIDAQGIQSTVNDGQTYIYMAIRRPNKVPTSGTEVYNAIASSEATGTKKVTGFPIDLQMQMLRTSAIADNTSFVDRLRGISTNTTSGEKVLYSSSTAVEASKTNQTLYFDNTGFQVPSNWAGSSVWYANFKRAKGFFDIVCYTGTGVTGQAYTHNLGVEPDMIIYKSRSQSAVWVVYVKSLGIYKTLYLSTTQSAQTYTTEYFGGIVPTATNLYGGVHGWDTNNTGATYVAYLFSTLVGISKVGSYIGNGTSQTINCGFSTGARFVLSKAVSTTGNWNIGDSTRGITSGTDPLLCLNTTAAEVTTDDWLDPESSGFIVNETASAHANTNGVTYIYLAIS